MIISEENKPQKPYPTVTEWERSLDPWHRDAFPDEFKDYGTNGKRKSGWMGVDWVGNPIVFIPDGTEEL